MADHLLVVVAAPALLAWGLWLAGEAVSHAVAGTGGAGASADPGLVVAAALLLGVAALSVGWSTLGVAVGGAVVLGVGITAWAWPAGVTDILDPPRGAVSAGNARAGLAALLDTGMVLLLGLVLAGLALGAHAARRAGRSRERAEAALGRLGDAGGEPVPPRSRAGAHTATVLAGLVLPPLAVLVLVGTTPVLAEAGVREAPGEAALAATAALALALLAASVAFSTAGALLAGALVSVGGYAVLRADALPGILAGAGDDGEFLRLGVLPIAGAVLLGGALGAHRARRSGARHERAERAARSPRR